MNPINYIGKAANTALFGARSYKCQNTLNIHNWMELVDITRKSVN